MSRDLFINGETLILVKGRADSGIGNIQQLGLADSPIRIIPELFQDDCKVDAWGEGAIDIQMFLASARIVMNLIHFDRAVLDVVISESMGGFNVGQLAHAGARLGNNTPRFSPSGTLNPATGVPTTGNHFIGLNVTSPRGGVPWRFFYSYLTQNPFDFPLGAKRSSVLLNWRVIAYTQDPYNNGVGADGYPLWDYNNDN